MNDTMKGNRIPREQVDALTSSSTSEAYNISSPQENVCIYPPSEDELSST